METYLINVIEDLTVTALLCGVVYAYARSRWEGFGKRVIVIAAIAAFVASVIMAYFKQYTSLIATGDWNRVIFILCLILFVIMLVCLVVANVMEERSGVGGNTAAGGSSELVAADASADAAGEAGAGESAAAGKGNAGKSAAAGKDNTARMLRLCVLFVLAGLVFLRLFYTVPDVINYPANFGLSTEEIISSAFATRISGWLMGIAVVIVTFIATHKAFQALEGRRIGIATVVILAVICVVQSMTLSQILIARRIVTKGTVLYDFLFPASTWVSNNSALFTLAIMVIAIVLAAFVIGLSLRDNEPYSNPAEHRRNKARWRNRRRWSICLMICLVFSFGMITVVKDIATAGPTIVASEECEIDDEGMHISLDQVSDGHLHRFTYTTTEGYTTSSGYVTKGGIGVRVIVIKKPNSSSYGIGLDACDICGTTGYYERDGQVVCNKCDVVMNMNTIGFKGGCNPIVIDYNIQDGYINIPLESLLEYEKIPGSSW